ncbi:MAG: hypothetical protein HN413_08625 [Chloroflexi bacterium]|jgi:uncharacterized membrane protein HdeD (DUF308 family)|nr:hypothetical protein [Chloroflexota bacterium]
MSQQTSTQVRKLVIGIVLLAAILMIVYVPFQSFKMVNPILGYQLERIEQFKVEENPSWPLLTLTTWLVSFFYPFWGTMSVLAGIALLAIAKALYDGKVWARGLSLFCLAIPSMGGAYMIVPWMNFVGSKEGGFPPAVLIMTVGLIPYFAVLLAEKGDLKQKVVDFLVFLMLGVTAAENFANGHAAFRILYGHPKRPIFAEGIAITYFGWLGLWVAFGLLVTAIYKLGTRKLSGWYLTLIAGAITIVVSGATHYVRHATLDYLYGAAMGLSLVVMMLIPFFKERLLAEPLK